MTDLRVAVKRFVPATLVEQKRGLLGYATVDVRGLVEIDRVSIRRTRGGVVTIFYPEHSDAYDIRHRVVWPSAEVRRAIEAAVLAALSLDGASLGTAGSSGETQGNGRLAAPREDV